MKRYVLGNYELNSFEISLLINCISDSLECNEDYLNSRILPKSMEHYFERENEILKLMIKELKNYGDWMDETKKSYVLGRFELDPLEMRLLKKCLLTVIQENRKFIEFCPMYDYSKLIQSYYIEENNLLEVMFGEVERYLNNV